MGLSLVALVDTHLAKTMPNLLNDIIIIELLPFSGTVIIRLSLKMTCQLRHINMHF